MYSFQIGKEKLESSNLGGFHVGLVWEIEHSKSSTRLLHPFLLGDGETLVWPSSEGLPKNAVKGSSHVPGVAVHINPKTFPSLLP